MCLSRVLFVITIAFVAIWVQPCCSQSPIEPFIDGFTAALSSAIFPQNNSDVTVELGREVSIGEVPYQIALYRDNYFVCGGAIIAVDWVLTAADCVQDGGNFGVRAGSSSNAEGGQIRHISAIVINGGFDATTKENDIALLRVGQPFVWSRFVRPAKLPGPRSKIPENLLVTGWGTEEDVINDAENQLRGLEVTYVPHETCAYAYLNAANITENVLCASVSEKHACQGDIGGPMAYQGTIYGIQSFGAGCTRIDIPGIFTSVQRQLRWIKTVQKRYVAIVSNSLK